MSVYAWFICAVIFVSWFLSGFGRTDLLLSLQRRQERPNYMSSLDVLRVTDRSGSEPRTLLGAVCWNHHQQGCQCQGATGGTAGAEVVGAAAGPSISISSVPSAILGDSRVETAGAVPLPTEVVAVPTAPG